MSELIDARQQEPEEVGFSEIIRLIGASREMAMQAVNTALIALYWQIGEIISRGVAAAQWGEGAVDQLASYIARRKPGIRGFSRSNLLRMRQFYETYRNDQIVAPLVRQISWSRHLQILGQCKLPDEREFYLRMAVPRRLEQSPVGTAGVRFGNGYYKWVDDAGAVVERAQALAIVGNPPWASRRAGDPPGIDEIRVGNRGYARSVGHKIHFCVMLGIGE
jgi:DUF1016 N-terminal domain